MNANFLSNLNEPSTPFTVFNDYISLKLAVSGDLDWKEGRRIFKNENVIYKRNDVKLFSAIAEYYPKRNNAIDALVSGFYTSSSDVPYIRYFLTDEAKEEHQERLQRCYNFMENLHEDVDKILEFMYVSGKSIGEILGTRKSPIDIVRDKRFRNDPITPETLSVLEHYFRFSRCYSGADPLWIGSLKRIRFYSLFFRNSPECRENIDRLVSH